MKQWLRAFKRGLPTSQKLSGQVITVIGGITLAAGLIAGPFFIPNLDNAFYRNMVWSVYGIGIFSTLMGIALIPYRGMKVIKKEIERDLLRAQRRINELQPLANLEQHQIADPYSYIIIKFDSIQINPKEAWAYLYGVIHSRLLYDWQIKGIRAMVSLDDATESYYFEGDGTTVPAISKVNKSTPFYIKCSDEPIIQILKERVKDRRARRIQLRGKVDFKFNGTFITVLNPITDEYLRAGQVVDLADESNTPKEIMELLRNTSFVSPTAS